MQKQTDTNLIFNINDFIHEKLLGIVFPFLSINVAFLSTTVA